MDDGLVPGKRQLSAIPCSHWESYKHNQGSWHNPIKTLLLSDTGILILICVCIYVDISPRAAVGKQTHIGAGGRRCDDFCRPRRLHELSSRQPSGRMCLFFFCFFCVFFSRDCLTRIMGSTPCMDVYMYKDVWWYIFYVCVGKSTFCI